MQLRTLPFPTRAMRASHDFLDLSDEATCRSQAEDGDPKPPDSGDGKGGNTNGDTATITKSKTQTKRPSLYRVLLLNDDYTPMEFVVLVLQEVFNKTRADAMRIMLHVHNQGVGECGVYPFEVAETKVTRVMDAARKNQHPLQCVMEKQ